MAYPKKETKKSEALQKLKADLAAGTAACAYIFYGEESYLRELRDFFGPEASAAE